MTLATEDPPCPPIVAIGASAGGIEAFRGFFQAMPPDSGLAFVIALHLPPDRPSQLAGLIARWTAMPVVDAADGMPVLADHVYVLVPGVVAGLRQGRLRLDASASLNPRELKPIDVFFSAMARDQGDNAVGIVLSGTGTDGALGLKAIKQRGGLTVAQGSGGSAPLHAGMPDGAIATGFVDLVVPVEQMPDRVIRYTRSRLATERGSPGDKDPGDDDPGDDAPGERAVAARDDAVRLEVCAILRAQVGHDFSQYKPTTFLRRVQRRIDVLGLPSRADYAARLHGDATEVQALFRDLLIGVTSFFRDQDIFEALERIVIPPIFAGRGADAVVRAWVPGCATGEEAYSLAILMREAIERSPHPPRAQIFATDIDEPAIAIARAGRYPKLLLDGVSARRRDSYFLPGQGGYVARREIRELCTFSVHSLIRDPPFSRMDLISCRNLLMYMNGELQEKIIPALHYALLPGGFLLLGGSETVARRPDLFAVVDARRRIFQRRDAPRLLPPLPARPAPDRAPRSEPGLPPAVAPGAAAYAQIANARVLERYAPSFVLVNGDGEVLHYSSHAGRFLEPAGGAPSRNLLAMARPGLHIALRAALRKAANLGQAVTIPALSVAAEGGMMTVTLSVDVVAARDAAPLYLVVFSEAAPAGQDGAADTLARLRPEDDAAAQLELELRDARTQLQSISEQYETALEELKSANEELHSVNEEFQSTNEELETSREEIQSMNEELQTTNTELTGKLEELDRSNSDLRNLFESTQVATIFLDRNHVIRSFTPAIAGIYNLIPGDQGRPVADIVSQLQDDTLQEDVATVLRTREVLERRVVRQDGSAHYLLRILPYRAVDGSIEGTLVTLVEVTTIVRAEQYHRLLVEELNHRVKNTLASVHAMASEAFRHATSVPEAYQVFTARLLVLARAHEVLTEESWQGASLSQVVERSLEPAGDGGRPRFHIHGPPVRLTPRMALSLAMALHELEGNAVKFGALSNDTGLVEIGWHLHGPSGAVRLTLRWRESGGPKIARPQRRGFGTRLIQQGLPVELGAEVQLLYDPTGLACIIDVPLTAE